MQSSGLKTFLMQTKTTTTTYLLDSNYLVDSSSVLFRLINIPCPRFGQQCFRLIGLEEKDEMEIWGLRPSDGMTRLMAGVLQSPVSRSVLWSNIRLSGFTDFIVRMKSRERRSWFEQINNNLTNFWWYNCFSCNQLIGSSFLLHKVSLWENSIDLFSMKFQIEVYKNRVDVLLLSLTNSYNTNYIEWMEFWRGT